MTNETEELLNLFIMMSSNDHSAIKNANLSLLNLSSKPNYSLNLLWIVINPNVENLYRISAGIQLKNIIDKNWQRGPSFTESDKDIIRNQILSCANSSSYDTGNLYNVFAEIIGKISRFDWNRKWPNLFQDLFINDKWFVIFRVCQAQTTRRLSQGIVLFRELAMAMSGEILLKWRWFISEFNLKCVNEQSSGLLLHNVCYQLKCIGLFIRNTHLLENDEEHFCTVINDLSLEVVSCFPILFKAYQDTLSSCNGHTKVLFYKLLKSMIWILLSYQHICSKKFANLSIEIQNFGLKVIFNSNSLKKTEKLSLLIFNLMFNYLKKDETVRSKNQIFDLRMIDFIRSHYLIFDNEEVENLYNDPDMVMECKRDKEDSIITYNVDEVIENLMVELVKGATSKSINEIMEIILTFMNGLESLNIVDVESFVHFIGIVIQSSYYADSANSKRYSSFLHCPTIIDRIISSIVNRKDVYLSEAWKNFLFKRCIWLIGKWVVDDVNIGTISAERLASASQWCFKAAQSSLGYIVKLEVCLYIEHVVEALDKLPSNFTDSQTMHDIFLNPSITTVVSVLDHTTSSDTHTRLIDILIKLFHGTNMWNNIDLVKTCANSIYNLWISINRPSKETFILRDRLLECLSTIVNACDPEIIQPILSTLSSFISDSLNLIVSNSNDNSLVLLENTLQLWHDIVYNSELLFPELDNIYEFIISPIGMSIELDKNQTTLVLEIVQAHVLLKMLGHLDKQSFSSLTYASWNHVVHQSWDPKQEEDLCVMRIQLFDLWLLGFKHLFKEPLDSLFEISVYSQFLCERIKELFLTTHCEPSNDQNPSVTNTVLTVLARLCLFDRSLLKKIIDYLSASETENQLFMVGLLDRWLLRIDNQSSPSIQQLFVLACIHWMSLGTGCYPSVFSEKFGNVINGCIQVGTDVPPHSIDEQVNLAKSIHVPAERHLRLAYVHWNPLNDAMPIKDLVVAFVTQLKHCLGLDKFAASFGTLDPVVQHQFLARFSGVSSN